MLNLKQFDESLLEGNESLTKWVELENMVFSLNLNPSNKDEIFKIITENFVKDDYYQIYILIMKAACVREFSYKLYGDLFGLLDAPKCSFKTNYFVHYLCLRNILNPAVNLINPDVSSFTSEHRVLEHYEDVFPQESIEYSIIHDDFEKVLYHLSSGNTKETKTISYKSLSYNFLSFAALCGSIKCFKYFLVNNLPFQEFIQESCVKGGNEEILEIIYTRDLSFDKCLQTAVVYHRNEITQWIIANYNPPNLDLTTCINSYNTLAFLYFYNAEKKDIREEGLTPLIHAVTCGHIPITRFILESGASVDFSNTLKQTPLMVAAKEGHLQVMELLIKYGANVNKQDNNGDTPLSYAVMSQRLEVVQFLLENGSQISCINKEGATILHVACMYSTSTSIIDFFLSNGISIEAKDSQKRTPIFSAISRSNIEAVKFLISKKANIEAKDVNGMTPLLLASSSNNLEIVKTLHQNGHANLDSVDIKGRTCIHHAAMYGDFQILSYLIDQEANFETRDKLGNTPLMAATIVNRVSIVQFLAQIGCDIEARDKQGWTPLERAAHNGSLSLVGYLASKGANVNAFDKQGWTPLHRAAYNGHVGVVRYLLNNDADPETKNKKKKKAIDLTQNDAIKEMLKEEE